MKPKSLLLLFALLLPLVVGAESLSTQPTGRVSKTVALNSAIWRVGEGILAHDFASINAAMQSNEVKDGDVLLVNSGTTINGTQTITKAVGVIGPGYYVQSKSVYCEIGGDIRIESKNVSLDGLAVRGKIVVCDNNVHIEHCYADSIVAAAGYECEDVVVNSCYTSSISAATDGAYSWTISNNVVYTVQSNTSVSILANNANVNHNNVYRLMSGNGVECVNSRITNNVIIRTPTSPGVAIASYGYDNIIRHNIVSDVANDSYADNKFEQYSLDNIFNHWTDNVVAPGYWGISYGGIAYQYSTDGSNCGALISNKPTEMPIFNPITIPTATTNEQLFIDVYAMRDDWSDVGIEAIEYFWDVDPGWGQGKPITGTPVKQYGIDARNVEVDLTGLNSGSHKLVVRARSGILWCVATQNVQVTKTVVEEEQIDLNDLLALRLLHERLNIGNYWTFENNGHKEEDFPGVTFVDHRVTEINLENCNLKGDLNSSWNPSMPELTLLNLSKNSIAGDLTPFVQDMPKLRTLIINNNLLSSVSGSLPASISSLDMRSQNRQYNATVSGANQSYNDWQVSTALTPMSNYLGDEVRLELPSIFLYNPSSNDLSLRPVIQVLSLESPSTVIGTYVFNYSNNLWKYTPQQNFTYTLPQNTRVVLSCEGDCQRWSVYPTTLNFLLGDANIDGQVDVLDVQHTLNYILATARPFNYTAANTYSDKIINVQDIVCTVNIILGLPNNARPMASRATESTSADVQCWFYEENERIAVAPTSDVAAIDLELDGVATDEVRLLLNQRDFMMIGRNTPSGSRYVIFSPTGSTIPAQKVTGLLAMSRSGQPVAVNCVDVEARVLNAALSAPTGIVDVISSGTPTTVETRLAPGIYIVRTTAADGSQTTVKIMKKKNK